MWPQYIWQGQGPRDKHSQDNTAHWKETRVWGCSWRISFKRWRRRIKVQVILGYIASLRTVWDSWDPVSKEKEKKKNTHATGKKVPVLMDRKEWEVADLGTSVFFWAHNFERKSVHVSWEPLISLYSGQDGSQGALTFPVCSYVANARQCWHHVWITTG